MAFLLAIPIFASFLDNPLVQAFGRCTDECSDCGSDMEMKLMKIKRQFKSKKHQKVTQKINVAPEIKVMK